MPHMVLKFPEVSVYLPWLGVPSPTPTTSLHVLSQNGNLQLQPEKPFTSPFTHGLGT